jgi:uncharacterized protein YecT (DUF1311 family)
MGRTLDIIEEIANVRGRRQFGSAMAELPFRLFDLEHSFKEYDKANTEIIRYFPVALIACLEGYFRMVIRELVDAGEPFLSNVEKPALSIKLDFAALRAIHGKEITVGELIAHALPLSRLEHVEGALSSLLGKSFLQELRTTTDRWSHEVKGEPIAPILAKPDEVYANVARTFELRHIICHELASGYQIEADEVARCFESCVAFLRASDECISDTLHPGAPLTQTDMNIASGKSLDEATSRLAALCELERTRIDPERHIAFDDAQAKWQAYCDAWARFDADDFAGGSIWPTIYGGAVTAITEQRITELSEYRKRNESV